MNYKYIIIKISNIKMSSNYEKQNYKLNLNHDCIFDIAYSIS